MKDRIKELSKEQQLMGHTAWRNQHLSRCAKLFGVSSSVRMQMKCGNIGFDVQMEKREGEQIVQRFKKSPGMPLFALISLQ